VLTSDPAWTQARLDRCASGYDNPLGALNTAFFQDGAVIRIPANMTVAEPIQLLFLTTQTAAGTAHHTRNLVVAEKQAQACVIETHASLADGQYVTNCLTELSLAPGAQIEHCRLQLESLEAFHFGATHAWQDRDSTFLSHSLALGARIARQDIRSVLGGEGGYALFNGLYLAQGGQLTDHHTVMDHARPHCESHEYYHGILDGHARGVFNGKIFVRPDAQKTDAKQTNRNLLLSSDATIDTKPQLEIFADDVKCTHGATVGQLDEDSLFYLRSRGIGVEEARRMLIHAFAAVVIQRLKMESIRPELDQRVLDKLQGGKGDNDR
jgi:Fe-S cluster assembly protein SufD